MGGGAAADEYFDPTLPEEITMMREGSRRRVSRSTVGVLACCALGVALPAFAQDEAALKAFFEGKRFAVRIDMPGTSDGIDIHPASHEPLDYGRYREELVKYDAAIRAGERVPVTLVKVKKDFIEFQLAGGGFGTFWDDMSTSVNMPLVEKSDREKHLEERIRTEDDRDKRNAMRRELDELRERRERENQRITAERDAAEARKVAKVAAERRAGGSRFNIRYDEGVPANLRPQDVMVALARYVDFGADGPSAVGVDIVASPTTRMAGPRVGMPREEAEQLFGRPVESFDRWDGTRYVTMIVFDTGGERITSEFAENLMIRYTIMSK
jgi:hypothetical protein